MDLVCVAATLVVRLKGGDKTGFGIIGSLEGETLPVRVMKVKGLQGIEAQKIFRANGSFWASQTDWNIVIKYYAGNPLVLKIVSTTIQKLFNGSLSEFLKHNIRFFGEIRHLLKQQFERLSDEERAITNWLAINRRPASFSELQENIFPLVSPQKLLEALESLEERCLIEKATPTLIEKSTAFFSMQPMVMEYVADRLIEEKITEVPLKVLSGDEYQKIAG